jgi:RNA polymerase sigma-70 factor, ECF subfamily
MVNASQRTRLAKKDMAIVGDSICAAAPDELLIEGLDRGDRRAAARIYDRLIDVVDSTLYRVLGGRGHDHDDLVQSAFEQIVRSLLRRQFGRGCSLSSWAYSVTMHVALNALRSRVRERALIERGHDVPDAPSSRPEDDVERTVGTREELERLRARLDRIPPENAEALIQHHVLGYPLAEVATMAGVSVRAAQSRVVRGRRELQRRGAADPTLNARTGRGLVPVVIASSSAVDSSTD